jgi:hypothetical protein
MPKGLQDRLDIAFMGISEDSWQAARGQAALGILNQSQGLLLGTLPHFQGDYQFGARVDGHVGPGVAALPFLRSTMLLLFSPHSSIAHRTPGLGGLSLVPADHGTSGPADRLP